MQIICCFCEGMKVSTCARHLGFSKSNVINYYDNLRGCYRDDLDSEPIRFFSHGPFEVDEVQIRHVQLSDSQFSNLWIFDILERQTGIYWGTIVPNRSSETLISHICEKIPPSAIVFSDDWAAYRPLRKEGFAHFSVNHSNGEYSRTGIVERREVEIHINTLEALHHSLRSAMANKSSRHLARVDLILAEFTYRHSNRPLFEPFKYFK